MYSRIDQINKYRGVSRQSRFIVLAMLLNWLEFRTIHQKAKGSIPGRETYLGCGSDPLVGVHTGGNRLHGCCSLSLYLSLKVNENISSGEDFF